MGNRTRNKIELIELAIQDLIQSDLHVDRHILTHLLSQLESLKEDDENVKDSSEEEEEEQEEEEEEQEQEQAAAAAAAESIRGPCLCSCSCSKQGHNDILVKEELQKLEGQTRKTHRLLSALILLVLTWQISELSLLFKLKGWLSNPFRSLGDVVTGVLHPDHRANNHDLLPLPSLPKNINQQE